MRTISFAAILLLSACTKDEPLLNGYRFIEVSGGTGEIISRGGEIIVFPNIVEHSIRGPFVIGKRIRPTNNCDDSFSACITGFGYFILDTRTGQLRQGLAQPPSQNHNIGEKNRMSDT